jgi:hypothetical protein
VGRSPAGRLQSPDRRRELRGHPDRRSPVCRARAASPSAGAAPVRGCSRSPADDPARAAPALPEPREFRRTCRAVRLRAAQRHAPPTAEPAPAPPEPHHAPPTPELARAAEPPRAHRTPELARAVPEPPHAHRRTKPEPGQARESHHAPPTPELARAVPEPRHARRSMRPASALEPQNAHLAWEPAPAVPELPHARRSMEPASAPEPQRAHPTTRQGLVPAAGDRLAAAMTSESRPARRRWGRIRSSDPARCLRPREHRSGPARPARRYPTHPASPVGPSRLRTKRAPSWHQARQGRPDPTTTRPRRSPTGRGRPTRTRGSMQAGPGPWRPTRRPTATRHYRHRRRAQRTRGARETQREVAAAGAAPTMRARPSTRREAEAAEAARRQPPRLAGRLAGNRWR